MRIFILTLLFMCGCEPTPQPTPRKKLDADRVYPVNPVMIARDRVTAQAYDNCRVSIKVNVTDFRIVGNEAHIPATVPGGPPAIVIRPVNYQLPADTVVILAVGRCHLVDDGIRRSAFSNFGILIECEYLRTFSGWADSP